MGIVKTLLGQTSGQKNDAAEKAAQSESDLRPRQDLPVSRRFVGSEKAIVEFFGKDNLIGGRPREAFDKFSPFIVCFTNRSGSNMLCEDIATLEECGLARESMLPGAVKKQSKKHDITTLTDYIYHVLDCQSVQRPGIKLNIDLIAFLYDYGILEYCFPDCRYVLVKRSDLLSQAVSFYIASHTKQWKSGQPQREPVPGFDHAKIVELVRNLSDANARSEVFFSLCGTPVKKVVYEQYLNDRNNYLASVAEFLGSPTENPVAPVDKKVRKQVSSQKDIYKKRVIDAYRQR